MRKNITLLLATAIFAFVFASCSHNPQFCVEGLVKGGADSLIYLEKREINKTTVVDSAKIASNGTFSLKAEAPPFPELYALRCCNRYISLGIDSLQTVRIETTLAGFDTAYTVSGSLHCEQIRQINRMNRLVTADLDAYLQRRQQAYIGTADDLKQLDSILNPLKQLCKDIISDDMRGIAGYFAVFQKIKDAVLFDPYDSREQKYYGAMATQWNDAYPQSPRSKHLRDFTLLAMKTQRDTERAAELLKNAQTTGSEHWLNISLPDINGVKRNLADCKGKTILLDFTLYESEFSPQHNIELNKAYTRFGDNLVIYQVAFDPNEHRWKNVADNLPWICVRDADGAASKLFTRYNITDLPVSFLFNTAGEIVKRIEAKDNIAEAIK